MSEREEEKGNTVSSPSINSSAPIRNATVLLGKKETEKQGKEWMIMVEGFGFTTSHAIDTVLLVGLGAYFQNSKIMGSENFSGCVHKILFLSSRVNTATVSGERT